MQNQRPQRGRGECDCVGIGQETRDTERIHANIKSANYTSPTEPDYIFKNDENHTERKNECKYNIKMRTITKIKTQHATHTTTQTKTTQKTHDKNEIGPKTTKNFHSTKKRKIRSRNTTENS